MRGMYWIVAALLTVGLVAGIAFTAYRAGERHDDGDRIVRIESPSGTGEGPQVEVVRIEDRGWGFFPGFILLPLIFIFVFFLLARGVFGGWRRGPWVWGRTGPEEWHRRQHEADRDRTSGGGPPAPPAG